MILRRLQASKAQLAIVREAADEKTLGIVTLEDVLESLGAGNPLVRVRATLGFLAVVAVTQLLALRSGANTAVAMMFVLPSAVLVQELQRALLERRRDSALPTTVPRRRATPRPPSASAWLALCGMVRIAHADAPRSWLDVDDAPGAAPVSPRA